MIDEALLEVQGRTYWQVDMASRENARDWRCPVYKAGGIRVKTRACIFCGERLEVRRTTVWSYDHFLGKTVRAPVGPYPDAKARDEILMAHEFGCQRRTIRRHYGCDAPLSMWGVPVPQDPND